VVAVAGGAGEGGEASRHALAVARPRAQALAAELETMPTDATVRPDVLVLPRTPLGPGARSALLRLRLPVLLVG
jgi:hypothetical protein